MLIFVLILSYFIYIIAYAIYTKFRDKNKTPKVNWDVEVNTRYKEFILQFNNLNNTNYSTSGDLTKVFNKCLLDYIFTEHYILPKKFNERHLYGISLNNYRYRNEFYNTGKYRINDCNLYELCECARKQDLKSFYFSLFNIPIETFELEEKVSAAKLVKNEETIKVSIYTEYIDTHGLWVNSFTITGQSIELKTRDLGDASKYE